MKIWVQTSMNMSREKRQLTAIKKSILKVTMVFGLLKLLEGYRCIVYQNIILQYRVELKLH